MRPLILHQRISSIAECHNVRDQLGFAVSSARPNKRTFDMFARRSLLFSGFALVIAACSSKSNQDDTGDDGVGGGYTGNLGGNGNSSNGGGNGADQGTGSTAADNNGGGANPSTGANAGTGNSSASAGGNGNVGGNGAGGGTDGCKAQTSVTEASPPIIEFQVDITSSMNNKYPPGTGQSRWVQIQAALTAALSALATDHPDWIVALSFFAKPVGASCYSAKQSVDFAPLSQNIASINNSISTTQPNGYTPTYAAWSFAFDQITTFGLNYAGSNKYIVLLTDGVPTVEQDGCTLGSGNNGACPSNCVSGANFQKQIDLIAGLGVPNNVKTFFVAIPGAEDPQGADFDPLYMLSRASQAGGTADGCSPVAGVLQTNCNNPNGGTTCLASRGTYCCVDLTQASNLTTELESAITTNIVSSVKPSCNFKVPQSQDAVWVDIQHTRVDYTASTGTAPLRLTASSSAACLDGDFYYNDPNQVTDLLLCPQMCSMLQANPTGQINVTFECSIIG